MITIHEHCRRTQEAIKEALAIYPHLQWLDTSSFAVIPQPSQKIPYVALYTDNTISVTGNEVDLDVFKRSLLQILHRMGARLNRYTRAHLSLVRVDMQQHVSTFCFYLY
jgi:hypothetical protein